MTQYYLSYQIEEIVAKLKISQIDSLYTFSEDKEENQLLLKNDSFEAKQLMKINDVREIYIIEFCPFNETIFGYDINDKDLEMADYIYFDLKELKNLKIAVIEISNCNKLISNIKKEIKKEIEKADETQRDLF